MKFQNPSLNSVLNGRKDERTNGQAESNMLPTFQSWGHKNGVYRGIHFVFLFLL